MASGLEYQRGLLADTIQEAVIQGVLDPAEAQLLKQRLQDIDSLTEADDLWTHIEEEYDILESDRWSDD
ncbi:hypothetical protein [Haloarcula nitratireducens]|uniref:Uncharacterized protein n=1 Tax=Haloarcula nitratireducens TaxID=2487749 RepID=A0AAW4PJ05_9EURY|nr:hypothetical protein [Halomicroarcula nitratireducens]MBX0297543.1 hypothetical protein [Halomicroarcula nitratireducens]